MNNDTDLKDFFRGIGMYKRLLKNEKKILNNNEKLEEEIEKLKEEIEEKKKEQSSFYINNLKKDYESMIHQLKLTIDSYAKWDTPIKKVRFLMEKKKEEGKIKHFKFDCENGACEGWDGSSTFCSCGNSIMCWEITEIKPFVKKRACDF